MTAKTRSTKPEDVIELTQSLRLQIVENITREGVPTSEDGIKQLSTVLRDLDAAALTTRKINVEESAVDQAARATANMDKFLSQFGGQDPFKKGVIIEGKAERPSIDRDKLPEVKTVPGQTFIGVEQLRYEDFVSPET